MTVTITGATGVIGRRLVEVFTDAGHDVVGLIRDDGDRHLVEDRGGHAIVGDVLEPETLGPAVTDAECIIHAATAIPTEVNPDQADWERNARVRVSGARHVLDKASQRLERVMVPSVVWVARQPDGRPFDEASPRHPDRSSQSAADLEDLINERAQKQGFDATILRLGFLYAPDATHTRSWAKQLLERDLPVIGTGPLGRGDTTISMLHADDAATAFLAALEADCNGCYHVVDEQPIPTARLFGLFADELGAPSPRRIPGWIARWFVGDAIYRLMTESMPTTNERFTEATGWSPAYETVSAGLEDVIETWIDEGWLEATGDGFKRVA